MQASSIASADSPRTASSQSAPTPKPTILSSPFFRSEILNSLTRDALAAPTFPHVALSSMIQDLSNIDSRTRTNSGMQTNTQLLPWPTLTNEESAATIKALQALAAQLAYLENSETHKEPLPGVGHQFQGPAVTSAAELELERLALRLHAGLCALLLDDTVRARASLDTVAQALRPPRRGRARGKNDDDDGATGTISQRRFDMRKLALRALAAGCWREGKEEEGARYTKWAEQVDEGQT